MSTVVERQLLPKLASNPDNFVRPALHFQSARDAFAAYLRSRQVGSEDTVLLPAYIGWSSREGSGVFDPVLSVGCRYTFYRMTADLRIDLDHVAFQLRAARPKVAVIIHYFGYPDPGLADFIQLAREHEAQVLEDEAHALLTDWVGGLTGRWGDAAIISLHKLLPVRDGGLLLLNRSSRSLMDQIQPVSDAEPRYRLVDYDFAAIAAARRRNAAALTKLLAPLEGQVDPLFPSLPAGVAPQTLPVVIKRASRDELYFRLNAAGFGVVSLYHTLIDAISPADFPESHWLAKRIMNLPTHQDLDSELLPSLIAQLSRLLQ